MEDEGHKNLIEDLEKLLADAKSFVFHDFKNEGEAFPKVALNNQLANLGRAVRSGRYDNSSDG